MWRIASYTLRLGRIVRCVVDRAIEPFNLFSVHLARSGGHRATIIIATQIHMNTRDPQIRHDSLAKRTN